ncbi:MAG: DUF4230 domain-containing protein [Polyangiales bacterium]
MADPEPRGGARVLKITLVLMLMVAVSSGVAAWLAVRALAPASSAEVVTTVRATPAVVGSVRALARLETVSFHMERVIDLRAKQPHLRGLFHSEDVILLVAAADVIAGVDLGLMRDEDLWADRDGTVHVVLPEPTVFSSRLDNDHTYVHTRQTDALARAAPSLETRARQEAETSLREAALTAGILLRARENAERTVRTLLAGLGAQAVEIRFRSEL